MADQVNPALGPIFALREATLRRFFDLRKLAPTSADGSPIVEHILAADSLMLGAPLAQHPEISSGMIFDADKYSKPEDAAHLSLIVANFIIIKAAVGLLKTQLEGLREHSIGVGIDEMRRMVAICETASNETYRLLRAFEDSDFGEANLFLILMEQLPTLLTRNSELRALYPTLAVREEMRARPKTWEIWLFGIFILLLLLVWFTTYALGSQTGLS